MIMQTLKDAVSSAYPIIPEAQLDTYMEKVVLPFLGQKRQSVFLNNPDGHTVYCEFYKCDTASPKGSIMISHGFSESCVKYREIIYYFLREGYNVCIPDHRNHGQSRDSLSENPGACATHIDRFRDYVDDFDEVVEGVLKKELSGPYYLFAHSMGGAIAALYVEQHPDTFSKVILNAPMFEINRGGLPYVGAKAAARILCLLGKRKDFLPGQHAFSSRENFENSAATSYPRYLCYFSQQRVSPHLQNGGSSCGWALEAFSADEKLLKKKNCAKVKMPVLLFRAEHDTYVLPGGQDRFIGSVPDGRIIFVPDAKHEIYLSKDEVLKYYLAAIMEFLAR